MHCGKAECMQTDRGAEIIFGKVDICRENLKLNAKRIYGEMIHAERICAWRETCGRADGC
jgi:hypothetical protein